MKVHCSVHNSLKLVSVLCQISLDQVFPGRDVNIHVKFFHHCHLDQQVAIFLQTAIKNLHVFLFSLTYAMYLADLILLDLFDEEVKMCSFYSYVLLVFLLRVLLRSFWVLQITCVCVCVCVCVYIYVCVCVCVCVCVYIYIYIY